MAEHENAHVVVVGAGLAGLTAARELRRRGYTVRILEASDRAGGRVLGAEIGDDEKIEVGGQWVGPTQENILGLIEEFGLATHETYVRGLHTYWRHGDLSRYDAAKGPIPPITPEALAEVMKLIEQLQELARDVDPGAPWTAPQAAEWDKISFEEWTSRIATTPDARMLVDYVVRNTQTVEASEVSLLHMVRYVAMAGNADTPGTLWRVVVTQDGASMYRVEGGSQRVPERLAEELDDILTLSAPVTRISQTDTGVLVETESSSIAARHVIVAASPAASAKITYDPPLPRERTELISSLGNGAQIKVNVVYDRPFWRDAGLSGYVCSDTGPAQNIWDNTPASGAPGVIVCFIKADSARALKDVDDAGVQAQVVEQLRTYFGEEAASPRKVVMRRWHEQEFIWGCPGSLPKLSAITEFGPALSEAVGRVRWAGTETAKYWQGFMDGAVGSGYRAAAEVDAALKDAEEKKEMV
jgi:monoamine oxidase